MEKDKKILRSETEAETEEKKDLKEGKYKTKKDWAEEAYQELADYIEEQGIYIRY